MSAPRARLLLLLPLLALAASCRRAPAPPPASDKDKPSLLFQGFSARASHAGELVWEAQAQRARVVKEGQRALAEDVTLTYFSRGRVVSRARADRAEMDLKTYDLDAEGGVQVHASNGVLLRTPRLHWDNRRQRASSEASVEVVRGATRLTGRGFTADRDLHDVRILQDVQAEAVSVERLRRESRDWQKMERP